MITLSTQIYTCVVHSLNSTDTLEQLRLKKAETRRQADELLARALGSQPTINELRTLCEELTKTFETMKQEGLFGTSVAKTPSGQSVQKGRIQSCARVFHAAYKRTIDNGTKLVGYAPFAIKQEISKEDSSPIEQARELFKGADSAFMNALEKAYAEWQGRKVRVVKTTDKG